MDKLTLVEMNYVTHVFFITESKTEVFNNFVDDTLLNPSKVSLLNRSDWLLNILFVEFSQSII